jgi:GNAT superfamily N-acetyltransferase
MHACQQELTVTPEAIDATDAHYRVAVKQTELVGFYSLEGQSGDRIALSSMFIDPQYIGKGIGRQLMERALTHAAQLGSSILTIQSDPNASAFYQAAGAELCGESESDSIPGRMLPMLQIRLSG